MKKMLLLLLALCCLLFPVRAAGFYDLPENHWAANEIQQAIRAGAVNGYGDGSFQPGRTVTAAQFCAMLSRTFLEEAFAAAPEGKYQAMDACLPVLKETAIEDAYKAAWKSWGKFVDEPLSRYDMAQIVYNLILEKDAFQEAIVLSTTEIADWSEISSRYCSAVFTCWGMGILQGQSDGRFAGTDSLNRAQACVVWSRLNSLFGNGAEEVPEELPEEEALEMPEFVLHEDETVEEMMRRVNRATPRCKEGCLPNGKARTEENIQELLELAKAGCPDGTVWSGTIRFDYKTKLGPSKGPLSFGMAVTDFVFGEEAPLNILRTLRSLSVGDVLHIQGGGAERILILTSVDYDEDWYTACELELNGKVNWGEWGPISGLIGTPYFTTVYRRWQ